MKQNTAALFDQVFQLLLECAEAIEYLDWNLRDRLYREIISPLKCIPKSERDPIRDELAEVFRIAERPLYHGSIDGRIHTTPVSLIHGPGPGDPDAARRSAEKIRLRVKVLQRRMMNGEQGLRHGEPHTIPDKDSNQKNTLKLTNDQQWILSTVQKSTGPLTRETLATRVSLDPRTIRANVNELLDLGLIAEAPKRKGLIPTSNGEEWMSANSPANCPAF